MYTVSMISETANQKEKREGSVLSMFDVELWSVSVRMLLSMYIEQL